MFNLVLTYILLFVLAGLLGAIAGWSLRQFLLVRHVRILERDLGALRRLKQAGAATRRL